MLKVWLSSLVSFAVLDFVWLGVVTASFSKKQLADIARFKPNGSFDINYLASAAVYLLLATCFTVFVWPQLQGQVSLKTFLLSGLMGLVVYGVYDLTNIAVLKGYPLQFAAADVAWGFLVFGLVGLMVTTIVSQ